MLTSQEAEWLQITMNTEGWRRVVQPRIAGRAKEVVKACCVPPFKRQGDLAQASQEQLWAIVSEAEWFLTHFEEELRVHRSNSLQEQAIMQDGLGNPALGTPANP